MLVYKIVPRALWLEAEAVGIFAGAPVDLADGFIHLSTADQLAETARRHFAGQSDLLLVAIEADPLGETLRWEPSRGGALFPHLYATLPVASASWVKPLPSSLEGWLDEIARRGSAAPADRGLRCTISNKVTRAISRT